MSALEGAFFCIHLTRLGFMPSPHLTGCPLRMHRWQPALGRHRPVSILVETSDGCCCRGSRLICQRVSLSPRRRSAPGQVHRLALLARLPCPHLDGRPPTAVGSVTSPRGVELVPHAEGRTLSGFFICICKYIYLIRESQVVVGALTRTLHNSL